MRFRILLICWLLCLAWPAAAADCPPEPELTASVQSALFAAQKLLDQNQPAKAAASLATWSKEHPEAADHRLSLMRGVLAYQVKRMAEAQSHFQRALELYPCFAPAAQNLALVYFEQKKPLAAAEMMLKAYELSTKPDDELLYSAAAFYVAGGQPAKGLPYLERLCAKDKPKAHWLTALVQCLMSLKRHDAAASVLRRLMNQEPGRVDLWRLLAAIEAERKDYKAAVAAMEVAYQLEPPKGQTEWRQLGDLYRAAGAPLAAVERYKKALGPTPDAAGWDLLAQTYLSANRLPQALEAAEKAATKGPTAKRWETVGRICMMQKSYVKAHEAFGRAAKIDDKDGRNSLMAGYAAWQMEKPELARQAFAKALRNAAPGSKAAREAARNLESVKAWIATQAQEDAEPNL
ncbi:tetratricopeptide repeat protein [Desulfarculus baarsii]